MSEREAFGPNLRWHRVQRGISLEHIAASTKVPLDLWVALERNDFSRWPTGLYARAYIRAYALAVGTDPAETVEAFCRSFPTGDRRAERSVREHAALIGHDLHWKDDLVGSITEEKRSPNPTPDEGLPAVAFTHVSRLVAATTDLLVIMASASVGVMLVSWRWIVSLAICALSYQTVSLIVLGCTPAVWAIETYLAHRHPGTSHTRRRFLRLVRGSDRAKA
jgi:hypothetical protein